MTLKAVTINESLMQLDVTDFHKEGKTLQITFNNESVVIFDINSGQLLKTIEKLKVYLNEGLKDNDLLHKVATVVTSDSTSCDFRRR